MNRVSMLCLLLAFAVVVLVVAPLFGVEGSPFGADWGDAHAKILWKIRIPRVTLALLAGAALATSGMAFQAMFRNPLATPFTLGVSSGASLGASAYFFLIGPSSPQWVAASVAHLERGFSVLYLSGVSVFAFAGALTAIFLVYGLARAKRGFSTATMLLAGVAIAFFFSSLILLMQYLSDISDAFRMLRWVMGGLDSVVYYDDVLGVLPFVVTGCLIVLYLTHELNLITTGEELAASRGVEINRVKTILFFAASLMVGAVVAVCGPIGFVGLMAPHICRLLIGPDHRYLTPATLLFGGAFLILCDTLARTVMAPTELPVGIITALLGGPFFLWLLLGRRSAAEAV